MSSSFFKWFSSWQVMRRRLFVLACLATLIGLFYAVENWRGKRAWEKCRRELEAQGYLREPIPVSQHQRALQPGAPPEC